ncbi:Lipopolysaccharide assembly protein A [Halioglobus japonicus]|nr:Lipopolysaccharide assembly protein A [Halioglobus japonicus]
MKRLRTLLTVIVVLAMLAASVLFALQNETPVPLDLLIYTFAPQSLALWVLLAFAVGGVLGMIVSSVILLRTRASLSACKKQLDRAREEASKLRGTTAVAKSA